MKSCTLSCDSTLMRMVESAVSRPVLLTVGFFLSLLAFPNISFAQNPLFVEKTGPNNPLLGLDVGTRSAPVFVDIDNDGDKDAFAGGADGKFKYYRRTGTLAVPIFTEILGAANPLNSFDVGSQSAPAFADLDADGDFDMISGEFSGVFFYFENTGTVSAPVFTQRTGLNNPLDGIAFGFDVGSGSTPALADFDGDGDFDCVSGESTGTFKYFENIGTDEAAQFGEVTGASNPFNGFDAGFNSAPTAVDLNNDGDLDVFSGSSTGTFKCYQNDGNATVPNFNEQLLAPVPPFLNNPLRPDATFDKGSNTTPLFVDMDNDTDMDVVVGENAGVFFYFENQASTCQPVISCVANLTVQLDNDQPTADGVRTLAQGEYVLTATQGCGNSVTHPVQITLSGNLYDCMDISTPQVATAVIRDRYNGFTKRCTTNVTVLDQIAPNAICLSTAFEVYLDESGQAIAPVPTELDNGSTDNCDNDPLNFSFVNPLPPTFDCEDIGTMTVWLNVTDAHSNSSSCSASVTVIDAIPPVVLGLPEHDDQSEQTIGNCDEVGPIVPTAVDNCSNVTSTYTSIQWVVPASGDIETYWLSWVFTDAHGNSTDFEQILHVVDDMAPILTCPADITLSSAPFECSVIADGENGFTLPTYTDCNFDYMVGSHYPGYSFPTGETTVSFIAYDEDGNTGACAFFVTVVDDESPYMNFCAEVLPGNIVVGTDEGTCRAALQLEIPYLYDNCTDPSNISLAIEFIDGNENAASVTDLQDETQESCDESYSYVLSRYSFPVGVTTVVMTATDEVGNTSSVSFTVTVLDAQPPVLTCPSFVTFSNAPNVCSQIVPLGLPEASDLCSGLASVVRVNPGDFDMLESNTTFPVGISLVAYKATDFQGNTSVCSYAIQVVDNERPVLNCPAEVTVNAGASCTSTAPWTVTATDNCSVSTTTSSHVPNSSVFNEGSTTVSYTATDASGNTSACSFQVKVYNTTAPVISCPASVTISLLSSVCYGSYNGLIGVAATSAASAEGCDAGSVSYEYAALSGQTFTQLQAYQFPLGSTTVTARASDYSTPFNSSSSSTCTFSVTVKDLTAPTVSSCPANIVVPAVNGCTALVNWVEPTAIDNCGGTPARTRSHVPNSSFSVGSTNVIYTFTDAATPGNVSFCTFSVTVRDLTAPVLTCPANQTLNTDADVCSTATTWSNPTASDACSGYTLVVSNTAGATVSTSTATSSATFPKGTSTVTYTATDNSPASNSTACSFTVTVVDNQNPTLTACPVSATYTDESDSDCSLTATWTPPTANDNCPGVTVVGTRTPGSAFADGTTTTIMYTATDAAGHTATCSFNITVLDNTNPTITCPASITTQATNLNNCTASPSLGTPVASDNCLPILSVTNDAPASFPVGSNSVVWTVTDRSARTATCVQSVTIFGSGTPVITCPATITVSLTSSCTATGVALGTPTPSGGACGGGTLVSQANNAPGSYPIGTTTVTWTAIFSSNSTATCVQNVVVSDGQAPSITCPANTTVNANTANCTYTGLVGTATATDNCNVASIVSNPAVPFAAGNTVVTYTATDNSGLTSTCTQRVTVNGSTPTITCPANVTTSIVSGCAAVNVVLGSATANANGCGSLSGNPTNNAPGSYPVGNTTVTWTATFTSGATLTCVQTVTVNDGQNPTISCPANTTVNANTGNCTYTGSIGTANGTDNCGTPAISANPTGPYPVGNTVVTYTATDNSGRTATCTQRVTVTGTAASVVCPSNVTVNATSNCVTPAGSVSLGSATANANGCGTLVGSPTNNAPSNFSFGATTVTWTAAFSSGTTATCAQTVIVNDTQVPTIVCPAATSVECTSQIPALGSPTTSDNCTIASVTNNAPNTYPVGNTVVTWTITDGSGLTATCVQVVNVAAVGAPGSWTQLVQRMASDGASGDGYGISVAISGDYAIVGSYLDDAPSNSGSAYIVERGLGGSNNWGERKRIVAQLPANTADAAASDRFGESVAIDGDWAVVGAPEKSNGRGAVYLYYRNQGGTNNWGIVSKLTAPVGDEADFDRFGSSVSVSGEYVIVGAKNDDNGMLSNQGAVYIYQRSGAPGTFAFSLVTKRLASDGTFFDEYGTSVSISGNYAVVGSPKRDDIGTNSNNGAAYVLYKDQGGVNNWGQLKKVSASDAGLNDNFGTSVSISGQYIVVGAPLHDQETAPATTDNGAAYVYQQNFGGSNNWGQVAKLLASDRATSDNFGAAVSNYNGVALVGSKFDDDGSMNAGSAYIFDGANAWAQTKLLATTPVSLSNDNFGNAVAIGSAGVIVGAFRDDVASLTDQGAVYFFGAGCTSVTGGNIEDRDDNAVLDSRAGMRCFPNPTSDLLNIDVTLEQEGEVNILITDAAGRIVSTVFSGIAAPEARYQWDVTQHPTGIYFVRVEGAGLRKVVPVSVIR